MSRTYRKGVGDNKDIHVRGVRRDPPDLRGMARALIELAQLEAEAEKQHKRRRRRGARNPANDSTDSSRTSNPGDAA
jgi:hypothetical protein